MRPRDALPNPRISIRWTISSSRRPSRAGEVARAKAKEGLDIELVRVANLLGTTHPLVVPPGTLFGAALVAPEPRPVTMSPDVATLVASQKGEPAPTPAATVAAADDEEAAPTPTD